MKFLSKVAIVTATLFALVNCKSREFNVQNGIGHEEGDSGASDLEEVSASVPGKCEMYTFHGKKRCKTKWGISQYPLPETERAEDQKDVDKVCKFAGSVETKKYCEYMGIRENHLDVIVATVNDDNGAGAWAHPKPMPACMTAEGILRFEWCTCSGQQWCRNMPGNENKKASDLKGWFNQSYDTCVATQSTGLKRSGAIKATAQNMQGTLALAQQLAYLGWKKSSSCKGVRPGDVVFTRDTHKYPGEPSHAFMFFNWSTGIPTNWETAHTNPINCNSSSEVANQPMGLAIDNNRKSASYKYKRPMRCSIPPPVDREGCWYYMRGPTPNTNKPY